MKMSKSILSLAAAAEAVDIIAETRQFLDDMGDNGETPLSYHGLFVVTGNADGEETLWVYIDSSVPGAGMGSYMARIEGIGTIQTADPISDPTGEEGI